MACNIGREHLAWMLADDTAAHTHPAVTTAGVRIETVCPIRVKGRREYAWK